MSDNEHAFLSIISKWLLSQFKKKREENVQKGICMKSRPNETGITARLFLLKKQQKD